MSGISELFLQEAVFVFCGSEPRASVFTQLCYGHTARQDGMHRKSVNHARKFTFPNILDQNASPQCLMLSFHL